MNQLYRPCYIREVTINKENKLEVLKYIENNYYIKYGVPSEMNKEVTNWKDLLKELDYPSEFEGHKDRKGRLWVYIDYTDKYDNRCQKKIYKSQFISAKSYTKNIIINPKKIRIKELVNELNAEEFILYLKDNGICEFNMKFLGGS